MWWEDLADSIFLKIRPLQASNKILLPKRAKERGVKIRIMVAGGSKRGIPCIIGIQTIVNRM